MNYMTKHVRLITLALAAVFVSAGAFASPLGTENNRTAEKARQAVEEAAPDDWYTYAHSAEKCIRKKVNLNEVKGWLERSIEIKETTYNLSVMGDYYNMNNLHQKALEFYVKSLRVGLEQDVNYKDPITHEKMMKARSEVIKASR
jgi:hypothetical protein